MLIKKEFFKRDALDVAPELVGKLLVRKIDNKIIKLRISEVEVYRGEEDTACHAHKGKTKRTEVMYEEGRKILCIFMLWNALFIKYCNW